SGAMGVLVAPLFSKNLIGEASTLGAPVMAAATTALAILVTAMNISSIPPISVADYDTADAGKEFSIAVFELVYAPLSSASFTSYGPFHLRPSFPLSFAWLASLFWYTTSPGYKLMLWTLELYNISLLFASQIAACSVSKNGVSPLLDFIMVRWAHRTCGISSIQSLLPLCNCTFIPSPKLLFTLSIKPLVCGCLTEAKRWRIFSFSPNP
ncbi:hypothetical protein Tco_1496357, partial [Tanacetum coccineum]